VPITTTADPLAPKEAIAYFRKRVPLTDDDWSKLAEKNHHQAFRVAGVADLDVITDVWDALDNSLEKGEDFEAFKERVTDELERAWGGTVSNPGWRIETIFRTNLQSSYAAGRYQQATHPDTLKDRPYWMLDVVEDDRTSDICADLDEEIGGKAIPADDPIWQKAYPPNHHACRSQVITLTEEEAREQGLLEDVPDPDEIEVDEDFAKLPDDGWEPDPDDYPDELADIAERFTD
jgi:SPP1 gp7 family putative phage head morphogenesis protein